MKNLIRPSLIAGVVLSISLGVSAQTAVKAEKSWYLKDRKQGFYGIGLDKAYEQLKGKKSKTVVVAVIDSGIDTTHEDLKPVLWTNPKEIPGNGIDDDGNGYVDDVHGWNFLGGRDGRNVNEDSYEAARFYHSYKSRFEKVTDVYSLSKADQELYRTWKRAESDLTKGVDQNEVFFIRKIYPTIKRGDSLIAKDLGKEEYSGNDLKDYKPANTDAAMLRGMILNICQANSNNYDITNKQILSDLESELRKADGVTTAPKNYRGEIVKDNENDINDRFYGNNDLMGGDPFHGTHVSGIIGAVRNNGKGIDGIADNVKIMMIRAVPDGDEHDKDIALAIRYAVDNGAKVINMSFGKYFSPQKQWVDDAVKYAESKGVLLVAAAGNEAFLVDTMPHYPSPILLDNKKVSNWIMVGASGDPSNGGLAAYFSNYGKKEVDLFAPGVDIYSTIPGGNTYGSASGTSMASPVTAGVAALVMSYYPDLTPEQVKYVLEKSAQQVDKKTSQPTKDGEQKGKEVEFSALSRTGGIVNASEAVKLAETLSQSKKPVKTKMKIKSVKRS